MRLHLFGQIGLFSFAAVALVGAACDRSSEAKPTSPTNSSGGSSTKGASDTAKLPGIDLSALDPSQVQSLDKLLDEKQSACGKPHSLRMSLKSDPKCKRSVFGGRYLVTLLKAGLLGSEAEEQYDKRFVSPEMGQCDVTNTPMRGNAHAPVTICEFSDFQCPHCRMVEPILGKLLEDYRDQVKVYFKNYPISKIHAEAAEAAAAAVAAGKQGKFWPMHDRLFENQDKLSAVDLERYATEIKLDVKRWKNDLPAAREAVERDHAEGEKLDITGTPTLYINGRKYAGPLKYEMIKDWVEEELNR